MRLFGVIVAILVTEICIATKIFVPNDDELLTAAVVNIADRCFGKCDRWAELLIVDEHDSHPILAKIHHESRTSNSILSMSRTEKYQLAHSKNYTHYSNTTLQWQESKPTAVIIATHSLRKLKLTLSSLKTDVQRIWRPKSYFLIVLETRCNVTESNDMFKIIWDYWILNAVIICSSSNSSLRNQTEIELHTFNPYSGDHSPQWETIIHEVDEVSINPGNFNHSWYVFKREFTGIRSLRNCNDLFFDKTLNLDGYVIPISVYHPGFLFNSNSVPGFFEVDRRILKTIATRLRFDVARVLNDNPTTSGHMFQNGSYVGSMEDVRQNRSHFIASIRDLNPLPGLAITYPHTDFHVCFASRIAGLLPQWTNMAIAKDILIGLGPCIIFFTIVLYLQNKPYGVVSAFLDAERLIIGNSIIHSSETIKNRIILGSIFLMLLVVDGSIRGRLISIITIARPYPNLDTLEQLKEQSVEMYGHPYYMDSIMDPQLKARFNSTVPFNKCIEALERGEHQRACFVTCTMMKFWVINSTILHGTSIPNWSSYLTFVTAMHWPLTNRYSRELQKLIESGIHKKWELDVHREHEVNAWKQKRAAVPPYVRPTKLNDMLPAFVLLFVGLSAALIVFAWEMKSCESFRCARS